jgi:hypothetical protein
LGPSGAKVLATALRRNRSLRHLRISGAHCGAEGVRSFCDSFSDGGGCGIEFLESDRFSVNSSTGGVLFRPMGAPPGIHGGGQGRATGKGPRPPAGTRGKASLLFPEDSALLALVAMGPASRMQVLNLQRQPIRQYAGGCIADRLAATTPTLRCPLVALVLRDCAVGDAGAKALARGLANNTTLRALDLGGSTRIREKGMASLSAALVQSSHNDGGGFTLAFQDWTAGGRLGGSAAQTPTRSAEATLFLSALIRDGCRAAPTTLELGLVLQGENASSGASFCTALCMLLHLPGMALCTLVLRPVGSTKPQTATVAPIAQALDENTSLLTLSLADTMPDAAAGALRKGFLRRPTRFPEGQRRRALLLALFRRVPAEVIAQVAAFARETRQAVSVCLSACP